MPDLTIVDDTAPYDPIELEMMSNAIINTIAYPRDARELKAQALINCLAVVLGGPSPDREAQAERVKQQLLQLLEFDRAVDPTWPRA